jgi:hypothetical protein
VGPAHALTRSTVFPRPRDHRTLVVERITHDGAVIMRQGQRFPLISGRP